ESVESDVPVAPVLDNAMEAAPVVETTAPEAEVQEANEPQDIAKKYIEGKMSNGVLYIKDSKTSELRRLELVQWQDEVIAVGDNQVVSVQFRDKETEEVLDLDVEISAGEVVDLLIRQVNGVPRYQYNENHERVTVSN
ncbi:MAG: hypothetical protein NUV91_09690, partial [Candidatus Omnitrophica bacterium]|nr:hypothetical protein [Candidatus Omnitrophota bacterium]